MPLTRSSAILIANPAARSSSRRKVERALALMRSRGLDPELFPTRGPGDAERLARDWSVHRPKVVVAAGGDGTINEVLNGLAGSGIPLGIIPLGTTNVLAKELGIPEDVAGAVERIVHGSPHAVSAGLIELAGGGRRLFFLMAGIGFDAAAVHGMNPSVKKLSGELAYILSGMRNLASYNPSEVLLNANGRRYTAYLAVIGKSSRYGGHFRVTPDARLDKPDLCVCISRARSRSSLLRFVAGVIRGSHLRLPDVDYFRATEIEVTGSADIQIDGDYLGTTPARITVVPDAIQLIY